MGVLQDFERRLEGAVEGVFARIFRSGLQPVELAKGLQRYARDTQHVSHDGVVIPNVYRFRINAKDHDRLTSLGVDLRSELASVVVGTAAERGWLLRGPAAVRVEVGDGVSVGRYELSGRIEAVEAHPGGVRAPHHQQQAPQQAPATAAPAAAPEADHTQVLGAAEMNGEPRIRLLDEDSPDVALKGRTVAGRGPACEVLLSDSTVSRQHAAFVRREGAWWVVDLGSTNGTKVNGRSAAEHPLQHGDRVTLGEAALEYVER